MKRATIVLACVAVGSLMVASVANGYDVPKQAKKNSIEMVTAFQQCPGGALTHRPSLAFPACVPVPSSAVNPANVYSFGLKAGKPDGSASLTIQAAKGDVKLSAKSKSIWKNGAPYSGNDLSGTAMVRATDNGCGPLFDVDCTIVDFPFPVGLTCTNGSCKTIAPTANGVLPGSTHAGDGSNIDVGQISDQGRGRRHRLPWRRFRSLRTTLELAVRSIV